MRDTLTLFANSGPYLYRKKHDCDNVLFSKRSVFSLLRSTMQRDRSISHLAQVVMHPTKLIRPLVVFDVPALQTDHMA